jgi:Asp-tRNA(Asn)/Glu-tRNA(Gln) amidotransferase A subunit family amidase
LDGASADLPEPVQPRRLMRLYTRGWENEADAATRDAFETFVQGLASGGVEIIAREHDPRIAQVEALLDDAFSDRSLEITAYEMRWPYEQYAARHGKLIEPRVHDRMAQARAMTADRYASLLLEKYVLKQKVMDLSADCDGFLTLSASGPAPLGLQHTGSRTFLTHATFLGLPAFSLPLLEVEGLPLGVQLIGKPHEDGRLCAMAAWLMSFNR